MTLARSLEHLDATWSTAVTPCLRASVRQLHSWTAGFPASTSDAPPDTARGPVPPAPRSDAENEPDGPLLPSDAASVKLRRIHTLMARITFEAGTVAYLAGTEVTPPPAATFEAEMAYVQFNVNAWQRGPLNNTPIVKKSIAHMVKMVDELANVLASARPADVPAKFERQCVVHQRAGLHACVDPRFAKREMCRPCGEWCTQMDQVQIPAEIVRMLDKGQYRDARRVDVLRKYKVVQRRKGA